MSKTEVSNSKKHVGPGRKHARQKRQPDERVRRTRQRLGSALVELIQEKPINDVTVQDVLDRASVGRSTFYLHYRDKDDLLLSQLEGFLEMMSTMLSIRNDQSDRVAPIEELFAHIGNETKLYRVLSDSGRLKDFFELAQGYFSRGIEKRLKESKRLKSISRDELSARACALAGSVLSLLRWWLDRGARESPHAMDKLFHRMVWKGLV
ncbi:MAG: TetR/AcrR family transcriptional regulator [Acidobacteriaceae bacterium]|nr:TetR/AcrR family transcriptional regulator [Acidobacteriaceae bacterium]MBV9294007.1 TetR/AcrR family transcriptional regulator [Acidobacteriaceae bacterium]MBV9763291.1 TetR/AcrR family transcriptional regulator [Acidobacteriaceae bacterium]